MNNNDSRRTKITQRFVELYGGEPSSWVRAPGRAELLGTDTDDHLGYVLTMAIHLDTWIAFSESGTDKICASSMNIENMVEYTIGDESQHSAHGWGIYIQGVSKVLRESGYDIKGVNAVIHSTVPIGGGLSSSASLEIAASLMFQHAGSFKLEPVKTAQLCQKAENDFVGVNCGILDQYSSVFGNAGAALLLDCKTLTHIEVKIPSEINIVICDTNVQRDLSSSDYGKRREECEEGTAILKKQNDEVQTLRDVNSPMFDRFKSYLPEVIARRCQFIVEENQRVMDFTASVVRDDREEMKRYCYGSFNGMHDLYEKTVPEMEYMHEAMMNAPGVIAARQSGGGFGGCMIAYVLADKVESFEEYVKEAYRNASGIETSTYVTEASDGAGVFVP